MRFTSRNNKQDQLEAKLNHLWKDEQDHVLVANTIRALDTRYELNRKIAKESGVEEVIKQLFSQVRIRNWTEQLPNHYL
jgi:hypothetical protein